MELFTCDKFQFFPWLYLEYMLRFLGLVFRDSLRFLGPSLTQKWQVRISLNCDFPPPPGVRYMTYLPIFSVKFFRYCGHCMVRGESAFKFN